MENWKQESPFLRVGLFVNSVQDRAARVLGRPRADRQAAALKSQGLAESVTGQHLPDAFAGTVDSICKRQSCKFPLKRYSFLW